MHEIVNLNYRFYQVIRKWQAKSVERYCSLICRYFSPGPRLTPQLQSLSPLFPGANYYRSPTVLQGQLVQGRYAKISGL